MYVCFSRATINLQVEIGSNHVQVSFEKAANNRSVKIDVCNFFILFVVVNVHLLL